MSAVPPTPPSVTELCSLFTFRRATFLADSDARYAPMFVGSVLGSVLYGILIVQTYIYVLSCKRDPLWIKLLIAYLFVADTANTVFDLGMVYEPLLLKWGERSVLAESPLFLRADVNINTHPDFHGMANHGYHGIALSIRGDNLSGVGFLGFAKFDDFRAAPIIWLMTSALADVVIAIYLVYALAKKKSNLSILNDQVDRIIRISIQTGAITAIGAATDAIVFIILPHSTVFFAWDLCLSKLYTNTLLSSLNARNNYRYRNVKAAPTPNALFDYSEDTSTTFSLDPRTTQSRTLNDSIPMYSPPKTKIGISTVTETYQSPDVEMAPGGEHWRRPPQFPPPQIYTASPPPRGSSSRSSSRAENRVPAYSSNTTLVAGPDSGSQASRPYIPQPQPRQKPAPF
ncbi:hypothetical protein D9758_014797 [Tetrapyrgos nigripes]|uniref:DUF6534 domain-containing protein n=1 Tax=Tetrapyrgos nigripes TaxID=182062 RepID=A0A8H5C5S7_9AGAR|nr:hypothetical protein D9758_014797 [Tetrapyrgos nigripes]